MKGPSLRVLLPLLLWPLAEIALFVMAGDLLGFWLTLPWLAAAMVIGGALIRSTAEKGRHADAEGALRVLAGALLILPGFLSDFFALILLLPPVRRLIGGAILKRILAGQGRVFSFRGAPQGFGGFGQGGWPGAQRAPHPAEDIIDGEATEIRPEHRPLPGQSPRSGWHQAD